MLGDITATGELYIVTGERHFYGKMMALYSWNNSVGSGTIKSL